MSHQVNLEETIKLGEELGSIRHNVSWLHQMKDRLFYQVIFFYDYWK